MTRHIKFGLIATIIPGIICSVGYVQFRQSSDSLRFPRVVDFGVTPQGGWAHRTIAFENSSSKSSRITFGYLPCHIYLGAKSFAIPAKSQRSISVDLDTRGIYSLVNGAIDIEVDGHPSGEIRFRSGVDDRYQVKPVALSVADLNPSKTAKISFVIKDNHASLGSVSHLFSSQVRSWSVSRLAADSFQVTGVVSTNQLPGVYKDSIRFQCDTSPQIDLEIPITVNVKGYFASVPSVVNFGVVKPNQQPLVQVAISGGSLREAKITENASFFRTSVLNNNVRIRFLGSKPGAIISTKLTAKTKDLRQPEIDIPVFAVESK